MSEPQTPQLDAAERIARIRLIRSENVGPMTFRLLLDRFGSARKAVEALPALIRRTGTGRRIRIPDMDEVEREFEANRRAGATLLVAGDPGYPDRLAAIDDAPPCISILGRIDLLSNPTVAIVGARNASLNGCRFAEFLAERIGGAGYLVVSGLARGIDRSAHLGSLESGTAAVLAGGVDIVYPPEHAALQQQIGESGALVAELPPGTVPQARHFPARNRIIAGLSLGVVVVEAARRSGSLITARRALDQGREVFAVPGSPADPRCFGTNGLIQEGAAHLVQSPEDVLQILGDLPGPWNAVGPTPELAEPAGRGDDEISDNARRTILGALGATPLPVDELIRRCQLSASTVATVILESELAGVVDRYPGNHVARRIGSIT